MLIFNVLQGASRLLTAAMGDVSESNSVNRLIHVGRFMVLQSVESDAIVLAPSVESDRAALDLLEARLLPGRFGPVFFSGESSSSLSVRSNTG